jgi:hypothetical protein
MAAENVKDKDPEDLTVEDAREVNRHLSFDFVGNYLLGIAPLLHGRLEVIQKLGDVLGPVEKDNRKPNTEEYTKLEELAAELIFLESAARARFDGIQEYIEEHGAEVAGGPESYQRLREIALEDLKAQQQAAASLSPEDVEAFRGMFGPDTPTV